MQTSQMCHYITKETMYLLSYVASLLTFEVEEACKTNQLNKIRAGHWAKRFASEMPIVDVR